MVIYTDGACSGNPGNGAWGFLIVRGESAIIKAQKELNTTNNRMELQAIIEAVRHAVKHVDEVTIYSDSKYCIDCYNRWKGNWQIRRMEMGTKNVDLWDVMFSFENIKINFKHVKGHSGDKYNTIIDKVVLNMKF